MGPGAGRDGGKVAFQGTVESLAANDESLTGAHLRRHLRGWRDALRVVSANTGRAH